MSLSRRFALRWSILVAIVIGCASSRPAHAQHGRFDGVPINPADEAAIFTPPGFDKEGVPAVAMQPDRARLKVTILDRATGEPTCCRVNVVGSDGNFYQPSENSLQAFSLTGKWPDTLAGNRPSKAPIRYFGRFFYTTGSFEVEVPPGPVRVEAWKGFEYLPHTHSVTLQPEQTKAVSLTLNRTAPMADSGWYSGDPHLHFIRASDADDTTIFDLLEAEDMRMGMVLCYNDNTSDYPGVMPEMATPQRRGLGLGSVRRRGDYQIISGQEYRNGVLGHLNLYLRDHLVLDGMRLDPNIGPMFGTLGSETRRQGGYAFHAHGGYALEIWADLVQGATNGVELLQFGIYRGIGLDGWYHVLNAGFRFPGIAACDYPACRKLGDCRTYVHVDGPVDFQSWLAGAAEGRSFMTSGPLLRLDVDGKLPGDTITTTDAQPLKVRARVRVQSDTAPVTNVQIIVNGQVVAEHVQSRRADGLLTAKATVNGVVSENLPQVGVRPGQEFVWEVPLELTEASWIAARAFSHAPTGSPDAESHTNPIYVHLNGKAPYRQADLDWLLERLDEQIADHEARKVPEKATAIDYFRRARETLLNIRHQGGVRPTAAAAMDSPESLADFLKPIPAKEPADAVKSFEVADGFRMELVAHEPDVTDPVAACFDEHGGMYVAEMIDYPYRPKEGQAPLGRVRYLEDADHDGRYERSWIFADRLVWPTGVVPWKGGVYVAAAPDIWYLKDTDGDHRADVLQKIFTGFGDRNQQGGVNNLNWGIDHTIYGSGSTNGGTIRPADRPDANPIVLSGRDFRFDPRTNTFETVSGSRQFGNAFDDWFNRFLCDESSPAFHVVLPQRYLARNPHLAVPTALEDMAPGVTPIFRISPIERWRQIRSSRRLAVGERSATSAGASHNVIDAAAGLTIYRGHAYPEKYRGQLFVGCSQNHLVHRRVVSPVGPTFASERADAGTEFVRSTDTWFRPVNCINAPDGTLYVLDMAREVIESIHIANDVVAHLDLTDGRDRGRIYRLAPPGFQTPQQPRLGQATTAELVDTLDHPGGWWRDTASRLIFERQDPAAAGLIRQRLTKPTSPTGRLHLLWALDGLEALTDQDLATALADSSPRVREHAVRLAEPRLPQGPALLASVLALAEDDDARVRFQVAFTLGEVADGRAVPALAKLAARDAKDPWTRPAVLSSCANRAGTLLVALLNKQDFLELGPSAVWLEELAALVGARNSAEELQTVLTRLTDSKLTNQRRAILLGLGSGLQRAASSLSQVRAASSGKVAMYLETEFAAAERTLANDKASDGARISAARLMGYFGGPEAIASLTRLLGTPASESLQLTAIRTLGRGNDPLVADRMIAVWRNSTPRVQQEIITVLASRAEWAHKLLAACEQEQVTPSQITSSIRTALVNHADATVKAQAEKVLGGPTRGRQEVIAAYQPALSLSGDAARGDKVYQRECMGCHRLGERGFQVGPNLALIRNRTPGALLEAILDPNREVHPTYVNYVVVDDSGRTTTGLILAETANSITLAREKGESETILKQHVEQLQSTGKSLMPEGLEKNVDPQGLADLLAFLKQVQYDIGTLPDFAAPKD